MRWSAGLFFAALYCTVLAVLYRRNYVNVRPLFGIMVASTLHQPLPFPVCDNVVSCLSCPSAKTVVNAMLDVINKEREGTIIDRALIG